MYCMKCGKKLHEEALYCSYCGILIPPEYRGGVTETKKSICDSADLLDSNDKTLSIEDDSRITDSSRIVNSVAEGIASPAKDSSVHEEETPVVEITRCSQCGTENNTNAIHCQNCGAWIPQMRRIGGSASGFVKRASLGVLGNMPTAFDGQGKADRGSAGWTGLSIVQLLIALIGLLPALSLNVPYYDGEYSLFDMMSIVQNLQSYLQMYSSDSISSELGMVSVGIVAMIALWIACVVIGALNIYRSIKSEKFLISGFTLITLLGIVCVAISIYLNSQLLNLLGISGSSSSVVSVSVWVWIMLLGSVGGLIAVGFFREMDRRGR